MDISSDGPKPIASWVRVFAWVIVVASFLAVVGVILQLSSGRSLGVPWYVLSVFVLIAAWKLPLFWIVALKGRAPRQWLGLGTYLWQTGAMAESRR